jgi:4-amino-4-deoxy-L-arabinose transferase-like glycosyltransferase
LSDTPKAEAVTGRAHRVLIVSILLGGAYLRSPNLLEPWLGQHNAWGGAVYGNIARNFLRYGYWQTHFAPVANSGLVPVGEFEYYYHYPPLLVWLISLSYQVFGVHEWSARLVPLSFSVLLMGLVYMFSRQAFSDNVAILSLLFCAVLPIESYYGAHVDIYGSASVFFSLLAVYGYFRWLKTPRRLHLAVSLLGVALGGMTAWYTYFVVPLILVHYYGLRSEPGRSRSPALLILPVAAVGMFLLFLLHRDIALAGAKAEVMGTLLEKLRARTSFPRVMAATGEPLSTLGLARKVTRDLVRMYYPPLLILTALWVGMFTRDWLRGRLQDRDWCVLILLGYGALHALAFPSLIPGHDFLSVCFAPGVCVAAAVAFARMTDAIGRGMGRTARNMAVLALLAAIVGTSLYGTHRLRSGDDVGWARDLERWGGIVQGLSDPRTVVLVPGDQDRVFQYYVDRVMVFRVDGPEKVRNAQAKHERGGRRPELIFVCFSRSAAKYADVLGYLDATYPRREEGGLLIYTLDAGGGAERGSKP